MKCHNCENYLIELDTCKFCHYKSKNIETGQIIRLWYGVTKFDEEDVLPYLSLEIDLDDGMMTTMTFDNKEVWELIKCFIKPEEIYKSINLLKGKRVFLLSHPRGGTFAPIAISDAKNKWIYKRGWENGKEVQKI